MARVGGKNTLTCTIAGHFDDETESEAQNILRANICSRQFGETSGQQYITPTIVDQLPHQYTRALLRADQFGSVDVPSKQTKDLFVGPWQRSDEIEGGGGPVFLRDLLETVNDGQLQGLKFLVLVTSRPHAGLKARYIIAAVLDAQIIAIGFLEVVKQFHFSRISSSCNIIPEPRAHANNPVLTGSVTPLAIPLI